MCLFLYYNIIGDIMEMAELKTVTDRIISNFVDELGLDGESYISSNDCLMAFSRLGPIPGLFHNAESPALKSFLEKLNIPQKQKDYILSEGLILLNKKYRDLPDDSALLITCIHERFHANRMILAQVPSSANENIDPMFYDQGKFVRNSTEFEEKYIDPNQDILLGSIDDSKDDVSSYQSLDDDELDNFYFANDKVGEKMNAQYKIDETLIELMAGIAYGLYIGKFKDIMDGVDYTSKHYSGDDLSSMSNIILRHNDLDLFKWMIDPLTYQNNNIHYDFFSHYVTEEDKKDVTTIIESEEIMPDDDEMDRIAIETRYR